MTCGWLGCCQTVSNSDGAVPSITGARQHMWPPATFPGLKGRRMRRKTLALLAAGVGASLALTACGANSNNNAPSGGGSTGGSAPAPAPAGGIKVGVILPETATSARWEGFDKPMLEAALKAQGLDPEIQNAQGDVSKFSTLADGMISKAVKVLIIAAINSDVGASVAQNAN